MRASSPSSLITSLQYGHGCAPGCPLCQHAADLQRTRGIADFAPLIRSQSALRLARHARRQHGTFPTFSDDPVVQFCIEEALIEKLDAHERRQHEEAANAAAIAAAQQQVLDDVAQAGKAQS
jgi:hypothetical protein